MVYQKTAVLNNELFVMFSTNEPRITVYSMDTVLAELEVVRRTPVNLETHLTFLPARGDLLAVKRLIQCSQFDPLMVVEFKVCMLL